MSNIINLQTVKDTKANAEIEHLTTKLGNFNKLPGMNPIQVDAAIEVTLERIREAVIKYYTEMYDEDEPNIAAHNLGVMLAELIAVAECNAVVLHDN